MNLLLITLWTLLNCTNRIITFVHRLNSCLIHHPGGALTLKGGIPMSGGQDPHLTPLPPFLRPPVTASFSSLDPHFYKKWKILAPTWEILKNFKGNSALQPKFASDLSSNALKFLKISSSLDHTFAKNPFFRPPFRRSAPNIRTPIFFECPLRVQHLSPLLLMVTDLFIMLLLNSGTINRSILKVPSPIFQNWDSLVCWKSLLKRSKSKISVKSVKPFCCRSNYVNYSCPYFPV